MHFLLWYLTSYLQLFSFGNAWLVTQQQLFGGVILLAFFAFCFLTSSYEYREWTIPTQVLCNIHPQMLLWGALCFGISTLLVNMSLQWTSIGFFIVSKTCVSLLSRLQYRKISNALIGFFLITALTGKWHFYFVLCFNFIIRFCDRQVKQMYAPFAEKQRLFLYTLFSWISWTLCSVTIVLLPGSVESTLFNVFPGVMFPLAHLSNILLSKSERIEQGQELFLLVLALCL